MRITQKLIGPLNRFQPITDKSELKNYSWRLVTEKEVAYLLTCFEKNRDSRPMKFITMMGSAGLRAQIAI